ncbi:hypothetical protein LTSEMIS_1892 [Salmonella enterica subsp. enterica serovar Mississippi str. A4-633]|nr:hypothetical protein LTSEMIS_1892 [Salmonella enterica subsp. enterica serovar Mississippi str. A4-633]
MQKQRTSRWSATKKITNSGPAAVSFIDKTKSYSVTIV